MLEKAAQLAKHALRPAHYGESIWTPAMGTFHQLHAKDVDGKDVPFQRYAGKVALVMNTACGCGYTADGYKFLTSIQNKYKSDLSVLAFPSNQFGKQESGDEASIKAFVHDKNPDASFDLMSKIDVNGSDAHPVYKFLKNSFKGSEDITWNFGSSFVVNRAGVPIHRFGKESYEDVEKYIAEEIKTPHPAPQA